MEKTEKGYFVLTFPKTEYYFPVGLYINLHNHLNKPESYFYITLKVIGIMLFVVEGLDCLILIFKLRLAVCRRAVHHEKKTV